MSFLVRGQSDARSIVALELFNALDGHEDGNAIIGELAARLLAGIDDAPPVLDAPANFDTFAWPAFCEALLHPGYWLSPDEQL